MAGPDKPDDIFERVGANRRDFLKRVLGGAAFAVPVIASFSIDGLWVGTASAQALGSQYCNMPDTGYIGPRAFEAHLFDQDFLTRLNGEATFTISAAGRRPPRPRRSGRGRPGRQASPQDSNGQAQDLADPSNWRAGDRCLHRGQQPEGRQLHLRARCHRGDRSAHPGLRLRRPASGDGGRNRRRRGLRHLRGRRVPRSPA